jgi:hypothetical protein
LFRGSASDGFNASQLTAISAKLKEGRSCQWNHRLLPFGGSLQKLKMVGDEFIAKAS